MLTLAEPCIVSRPVLNSAKMQRIAVAAVIKETADTAISSCIVST